MTVFHIGSCATTFDHFLTRQLLIARLTCCGPFMHLNTKLLPPDLHAVAHRLRTSGYPMPIKDKKYDTMSLIASIFW